MAIDNVLLLLLVPWAGPVSDRATARGRGRLPLVLGGFALSSLGMALLPASAALGLAVLIGALILLHTGINIQRSPFQALMVDLVPSRYRSLATASVTFQMCVGAIVFLMIGRVLGMARAFVIAAGTVIAIAAVFRVSVREARVSETQADTTTFAALRDAAWSAVRGAIPGMRAIFIASLLLQLTFQTFTTWYALHATERFGVRPEDVTTGFIAWALGGVAGALPAGFIGLRIGRRNTMLAGFGLMAAALLALDRVASPAATTALLALASASWTLPTVNAYPLFVEPVPNEQRGILAALFLLCMALGGGLGDPLNGAFFDWFGGYRPLFLMMAVYSTAAFAAVLAVPRGTGEAQFLA
jgi:MFS family permease